MNANVTAAPPGQDLIGVLGCLIVPFAAAGLVVALVWSLKLDNRHQRPYTLLRATSKEKWRWAATYGFGLAVLSPLLGVIATFISPRPDQWAFIPLCTFAGIPAFLFFTAANRLSFEWTLSALRSTSRSIRSGRLQGLPMLLATRPALRLAALKVDGPEVWLRTLRQPQPQRRK